MPSGKPGNPQGQGRDRGQGRPEGARAGDPARGGHDAAQGLRERAEGIGHQIHEGYDSAREATAHRYRQAEGMIARNPAPSVLLGFGVGFGLGVLLVSLLAREEERSWYERYVPDSLRDLRMPEALRHVPEMVRHIPEMIHR